MMLHTWWFLVVLSTLMVRIGLLETVICWVSMLGGRNVNHVDNPWIRWFIVENMANFRWFYIESHLLHCHMLNSSSWIMADRRPSLGAPHLAETFALQWPLFSIPSQQIVAKSQTVGLGCRTRPHSLPAGDEPSDSWAVSQRFRDAQGAGEWRVH